MKVYDCFTFFNELDLLEIRLNELNNIVDYFVLVESTKTWQNKNKPCIFEENKTRYKDFLHKIIRVEVPAEKYTFDTWNNERLSFNYIIEGLQGATDEDLIMLSAMDEIPKQNTIKEAISSNQFPKCVITQFYQYYLNTKFDVGGSPNWHGTYLTKLKNINKNNLYSFVQLRKQCPSIYGGWHFTFLGNESDVYTKTNSYAHTEFKHFSKEHFRDKIDNLKDPFDRGETIFNCIEDVKNLPIYVQNNLEKFLTILKNKNENLYNTSL